MSFSFIKYIQHFEQKQTQPIYSFHIGDYIKIGFWETTQKKRVQFFEGIVIAIKQSALNQRMITLRRPGSYGIERVFASNSPQIQNIQLLKQSTAGQKYRRSKLFYLRKRIGKAAFG